MPYVDASPKRRLDLSSLPLVLKLGRVFARRDRPLFLVGGSVRNLLLDKESGDLDFTTPALPDEVERLLRQAGASVYPLGKEFGTIAGAIDGATVEITTFRSETYTPGSRKPEVKFGRDLRGDLSRRDFTMNALAVDALSGELEDPCNGERDLRGRVVRAVGDAAHRFEEDPLRLLRAVRFMAELGFRIEPATLAAIERQAHSLSSISRERIASELNKLLVAPHAAAGVRAMCDLGLMQQIWPDFLALRGMLQDGYQHKDVYEHTLQVVAGVPPSLVPRLAALLHDIAKPKTRSVDNGSVHFIGHEWVGAAMARRMLAELRYSAETIERVASLVELHQRANAYEPEWTDGAVRRFMRDAGDVLDELLTLSRADVTTQSAARKAAAHRRADELQWRVDEIRAREDVAQLKSPLDGNELMALFGRKPGAWIRPIKEHLLNLVIEGQLGQDDLERATEIARQYHEEHHIEGST